MTGIQDRPSTMQRRRQMPVAHLFVFASGCLLLIGGSLEWSFRGSNTALSTILIVGGLSLLIVTGLLERRRLVEYLTHRSSLYGVNNALLLMIVALILVMINMFAYRFTGRTPLLFKLDLTRNQFYTLSRQSGKILSSIHDKVSVLVFFIEPRGAGPAARITRRRRSMLDQLLRMYTTACPYISFRFVDYEKEPSTADKYRVNTPGTLVLLQGEKKVIVKPWSIFRPRNDQLGQQAAFTGEQAVTNALVRLTRKYTPTVYFVVGHNEKDLNDTGIDGLSRLRRRLEWENYRVERLNILKSDLIPANASCLAIMGPARELSKREEELLSQYIEKGGNLLLCVDNNPPDSFRRLLKPIGVKLGTNVIIDLKSSFFKRPTWPILKLNGHVITNDLIRFNMYPTFIVAGALSRFWDNDKYVIRTIAQTSRQSWAETDFTNRKPVFNKDREEAGPLMAAFAVTSQRKLIDSQHQRQSNEFRMVVLGDSDFATNRAIDMQANSDFFLNCLAWVSGEANTISIRAKEVESEKVPLTEKQTSAIFYCSTFALPSLILLAGLLVWWRRRGR